MSTLQFFPIPLSLSSSSPSSPPGRRPHGPGLPSIPRPLPLPTAVDPDLRAVEVPAPGSPSSWWPRRRRGGGGAPVGGGRGDGVGAAELRRRSSSRERPAVRRARSGSKKIRRRRKRGGATTARNPAAAALESKLRPGAAVVARGGQAPAGSCGGSAGRVPTSSSSPDLPEHWGWPWRGTFERRWRGNSGRPQRSSGQRPWPWSTATPLFPLLHERFRATAGWKQPQIRLSLNAGAAAGSARWFASETAAKSGQGGGGCSGLAREKRAGERKKSCAGWKQKKPPRVGASSPTRGRWGWSRESRCLPRVRT
ncbi:unnamed protein product [Urochloa humidicola]